MAESGLFEELGTIDEVLTDVLFGKANTSGNLPFELPFFWEDVENQKEDVPNDSKDPLYPFGYGLSYK